MFFFLPRFQRKKHRGTEKNGTPRGDAKTMYVQQKSFTDISFKNHQAYQIVAERPENFSNLINNFSLLALHTV